MRFVSSALRPNKLMLQQRPWPPPGCSTSACAASSLGIGIGIGVSAGPAVAGNVGANRRLEYTVIGDPVNEAARLCDLAKRGADRVLASGAALERASAAEAARWKVGEETVLRGRRAATQLAIPGNQAAKGNGQRSAAGARAATG